MSEENEEKQENETAEALDGGGRALVPMAGDDERRGPGRPKGSLNQRTIAMRTAIAAVFEDLQARHEGKGRYPHFLAWAEGNPTEFYRIAARQLPVALENVGRTVGAVIFRGIND